MGRILWKEVFSIMTTPRTQPFHRQVFTLDMETMLEVEDKLREKGIRGKRAVRPFPKKGRVKLILKVRPKDWWRAKRIIAKID